MEITNTKTELKREITIKTNRDYSRKFSRITVLTKTNRHCNSKPLELQQQTTRITLLINRDYSGDYI